MKSQEYLRKQEEIWLHNQEMLDFMARYRYKDLEYKQLYRIYAKNALQPQFQTTLVSALALVFLPGLTNVYYTFRPQGLLNKVMPFVMPIVCTVQYVRAFRNDLESFCFLESDSAEQIRRKIIAISELQFVNPVVKSVAKEIRQFESRSEKQKEQQNPGNAQK